MDFYNDVDPTCVEWLKNLVAAKLIPPGIVDSRDVREIPSDELRRYRRVHLFAGIGGWPLALELSGWPDDRPVWTGSCPCQPFSCAGKRKGKSDERHLWPEFLRLIRSRRPAVVFGEQVSSDDGLEWLAGVRADLAVSGYRVGSADLCAAGVGAPHIRQRLYWVADPNGGKPRNGRVQPGGEHGLEPEDGGTASRLAHSELQRAGAGVEGVEGVERSRRNRPSERGEAGRVELPACDGRIERGPESVGRSPAPRRGPGGLGDTDHQGSQGRKLGGDGADECAVGAASLDGWMDDTSERGRSRRSKEDQTQDGPSSRRSVQAEGPSGPRFWDAYDLVHCSDGKARRVEPGTFPLAHGVPGRVGKLRAYGNAIVPQVAAQFIRAYLEVAL